MYRVINDDKLDEGNVERMSTSNFTEKNTDITSSNTVKYVKINISLWERIKFLFSGILPEYFLPKIPERIIEQNTTNNNYYNYPNKTPQDILKQDDDIPTKVYSDQENTPNIPFFNTNESGKSNF